MKRVQVLLGVLLLCAVGISSAATVEMTVNGLVCAFCAQGIEKKLRKFPATADVVVSLEKRLVAIALKDNQNITDEELRKALTDAGYSVKAIARTDTPLADVRARVSREHP